MQPVISCLHDQPKFEGNFTLESCVQAVATMGCLPAIAADPVDTQGRLLFSEPFTHSYIVIQVAN